MSSSSSSSSSFEEGGLIIPFYFEQTNPSPVWCMESSNGYLFAGTGDSGILLRSSNGSFWENFYQTNDTDITAIHAFSSLLFSGTSPNGNIYITDLETNETILSNVAGASITSFVDYNGEVYASTTSNIYKYNSLTGIWDFFYKPYGNIYEMKVINNTIYVVMDVNQIIYYDGKDMRLVNTKQEIKQIEEESSSSSSGTNA